MRRAYQIAGLAFVLLAAFLAFHAWRLPYYTPLGPGPGFFPLWLCGLLAALSAFVLLRASLAPQPPLPAGFFPSRNGALRIAIVLVALFAVAASMRVAGFRLTMLAFFLLLLATLGKRHPVETVVLALAGSFGVYHVFTRYLSQPLPVGVLGW